MEHLSAETTAARLPYLQLADAIAQVIQAWTRGEIQAPERTVLSLPGGGTFLVMPATSPRIAITKLVTVHPQNATRNLPTIESEVIVIDAATGVRRGILEGKTVTARRTAALSLLAAKLLAPNSTGPLLIVGAGTQGRAHLEAFVEGLGVRQVYIASRTRQNAAALAAYAQTLGVHAEAVAHPEDALEHTPLVVTATTSSTPVLPPTVREDAFIAAVGAFRPEMAELPPTLVQRARVYVDTLEGAQAEAGDLIQARVNWAQVVPLQRALTLPRPATGPVVFKSVGSALWDLAAAMLVYGT